MAKKTETKNEMVDISTGEIVESKSVAVNQMTISEKSVMLSNGQTYKLARRVTVPLLSWKEVDVPIPFTSTGPYIYTAEKKTKKGETLPATPMMPVIDLNTGREARLIVGAIMQSLLEDEYPNNSYVNKSFVLLNRGKPEGKRFNDIELVEIEQG